MRIELYYGVNNESWREWFNHIADEITRQELADGLAEDVWWKLVDDGHDVHRANQQRRGAFVICQTPEADDLVYQTIHECLQRGDGGSPYDAATATGMYDRDF